MMRSHLFDVHYDSFDLDSVQFAKYFKIRFLMKPSGSVAIVKVHWNPKIFQFTHPRTPVQYINVYSMGAPLEIVCNGLNLILFCTRISLSLFLSLGIISTPQVKLFLKTPLIQRIYFKCKLCKQSSYLSSGLKWRHFNASNCAI